MGGQNIKILHLSGAKSWGGNEQQLVDSILSLNKIKVTNFVLCIENTPLHLFCENNAINFRTTNSSKGSKKKYRTAILKTVKELNIDLIHLHTSDVVTSYVLASVLNGLKTKGIFSKKGIGNSYSILSKLKYNYSNIKKIICVSNAVLKAFKTDVISPKNRYKLQVIYDGINTDRIQNYSEIDLRKTYKISERKVILLNIANHAKAKNLETLILSIDHLVNHLNQKNIHLFQIGSEGKDTEIIKEAIEKYNLKYFITLCGFVKNSSDVINQADIYVMSSEREGLPLTIYEAFYKKVAVVSTKAGGIPEAIEHQKNGLLAPVKDSKKLAESIQLLIQNPELKNKFTEASYAKLMNEFNSDKLASEMKTVYLEILNS